VEASSEMFRAPVELPKKKPVLFRPVNTQLLQGDWVKSILWGDSSPPEKPFPNQLLLDLNDPFVFPEDISR
jgi:hypothetical protein